MTILRGSVVLQPGQKKPEEIVETTSKTNIWGKPIAPTLKTRSNNAMFSGENVF